MSERKRMFLLITIMITSCLVVAGTTISILYKTALKEQRVRLMETAQSQARLIEAVARFDAVYSKNYPGGAKPATLSQIIDAHEHYTGFGKTGEFTLSEKEDKSIVFLLSHRHYDLNKPKPVLFESELAEPMRRALLGQSGTVVGLDYRGEMVLAYEPVAELNLGIVAKIDMIEIRAPFMKAGLIGVFFTALVVFIGTSFFIRITNPMIRQLEKRTLELKKLNNDMKVEINERKQAEETLLNSEQELAIRNKIADTFLTFSDENVYSEVLNVVMEAMGSNKGFFGYIDEDGDLVCPSMTREIWDQCMIPNKTIVFPRDSWGGLWGKSLLEKKTLYFNDPLSVPEGHVPLNRALSVPIIFRDKLTGQIVVANKEIDYDQKDRNLLETIADSMAPILKARLQRDNIERRREQAEEALRNAHDELEQRVEVRTAELLKANEHLQAEIEERKKVEAALRQSESRLNDAQAVAHIGSWNRNLETNELYWSDEQYRIWGYEPGEVIPSYELVKSHVHPDDLKGFEEAHNKTINGYEPYDQEYRIIRKDGEIRTMHSRAKVQWDNKGNATRMSGSLQDITDRKRQEVEFRKTEKLLQTVFDGITEPLVLLDENLKVKILNNAALKYYRVEKPQDINGLCCYEALVRKSEPCEGCQVPAMVANRKSGSFERIGMMNPNNLEQVTIYNFDEKDHVYGGTLMHILDITKTRLMERKMIHNEKLAYLGLMVSCISHEITNPVSAITFNAPILKDYIRAMISIVDDYAKDRQDFELFQMPYPQFRKDVLKIIENIHHASQRIKSIVSDLRKLYGNKKQQIKRWYDLKQVIEQVIAVVGVEINQRVKSFEVNIPENLPKIYTDSDSVEQILTNLLSNAVHAVDKEDSRVKLDVTMGNTWQNHLIIEVSDNGCGMEQETLSKIFKPFFSTKESGMGTGLGLYVCQDIVQDLGGRIEVQSELDEGSVFRVVLPDIERRSMKRV